MRTFLACLVVIASGSQILADDPKGDLAKVQGKWTAMVGPEDNIPLSLEIKDKTVNVVVKLEGEELKLKGEFAIDDTKIPKEWTWLKFKGSDGNEMGENRAIYKLDGDELTICNGGPGKARPTDFKAGAEPTATLLVLKRKKDEKK